MGAGRHDNLDAERGPDCARPSRDRAPDLSGPASATPASGSYANALTNGFCKSTGVGPAAVVSYEVGLGGRTDDLDLNAELPQPRQTSGAWLDPCRGVKVIIRPISSQGESARDFRPDQTRVRYEGI